MSTPARIPRAASTLCVVAVLTFGGSSAAVAAPTSETALTPRVVDFAGSRCDDGCLRTRPARWLPSRIPRQGLGVGFYRLRWSGWGTARPRATGIMRVCAGSDCSSGRVRIQVFSPGASSRGRIYRCLRFANTYGVPELQGATANITADVDSRLSC